jgi:hypothetical protein
VFSAHPPLLLPSLLHFHRSLVSFLDIVKEDFQGEKDWLYRIRVSVSCYFLIFLVWDTIYYLRTRSCYTNNDGDDYLILMKSGVYSVNKVQSSHSAMGSKSWTRQNKHSPAFFLSANTSTLLRPFGDCGAHRESIWLHLVGCFAQFGANAWT